MTHWTVDRFDRTERVTTRPGPRAPERAAPGSTEAVSKAAGRFETCPDPRPVPAPPPAAPVRSMRGGRAPGRPPRDFREFGRCLFPGGAPCPAGGAQGPAEAGRGRDSTVIR
jgi:hypothetical protein